MTLLPKNPWRIALAIVALLLALISIASTNKPPAKQEVIKPAPRPQTHGSSANTDAGLAIPLKQISRASASKTGELFKPKSWYVAPPPPPPPPPPKPTAPPLPFTFIGKTQEPDGTITLFLSGHDRVYLVKSGDTIDGIYRIDGIKNGQLTLTYLPLQIQQSLTVGDSL